jgi:phage gp36-like protein
MSYITLVEAKQYLGDIYESAYLNVITGLADETILQDDIDGVTGVIDSYVKQLYSQTLTGAQTLVMMRGISEQLLYAKAYERFDSSEVPDFVRDRYDRGIFRLKDIQSGVMLLVDEVQAPRGSSFVYSFNSANSDGTGRKVFDRNSMSGI